jgi:hypothetical protein
MSDRISAEQGFHKVFSKIFLDMGEIGKWRQLDEKKQNGVVWDLGFYEMRWILKILI